MSLVAIITARGGSKGLPRKNVLDLAGKPLIAHSIDAALQSGVFAAVYVSTEDDEIKQVARAYGARIIDRPVELATDGASSLDVIAHTLDTLHAQGEQHSHFMLLQPTSPLRTAAHIQQAWAQYRDAGATQAQGSLVSVTREAHTPYKQLIKNADGQVQPLMGNWAHLTMPRQQLPDTYRINGAIYIGEIEAFMHTHNLFEQPMSMFEMEADSSIDVDTRIDLDIAIKLMSSSNGL